MAKLRAAVLAAGRGVRMGGETPKSLIPVRAHEPLLYYILGGLEQAGVDDLLVVTGHRPTDIERYVGEHWSHQSQFVFNARYASWGNFHSVRLALDQSPGFDLLVLNSDVVVHPQVLKWVIRAPGDLVMAIEKRDDLDDEDMRVRLRGDEVLAIGKNLKRAFGHGEFAGVSLLRAGAARPYLELSTEAEWSGDTGLYYEDIYARMLDRVEARAVLVEPGEYAEVDRWSDMEAAAKVIQRHRDEWEGASARASQQDEMDAASAPGGPTAATARGGEPAARSETG